jgi:Flp pilus assembly protein TadB
MTCPSCGGACGPEALKKASNEILLAEINARRESAVKQLDEFYKTHWSWRKFSRICMPLFAVIGFLYAFAAGFIQILQEPIVVNSMGIVASFLLIVILIDIFKSKRIFAQFKKEYPEEAELLSGI